MTLFYEWTIGCQMNRAESLRISSRLEELGYTRTLKAEDADIVFLNTCVVRQNAEDKAVNKLQNLRALKKKSPWKIIALTGCLVDGIENTKSRFPFVDIVFSAGHWPQKWLKTSSPSLPSKAEISSAISIMQGCDQFCSYCIVPYRRGREVSRKAQDITTEARALVSRGAQEIVLLGQNVDAYGKNLPEPTSLADLLCELNKVEDLKRIRFLTSHPKDLSERLIDAMSSLDKVCHQISLPAQSADNGILEKMRRGYTIEQYQRKIDGLRKAMPNIALSNDIIVGFPTESNEAFENTYRHLETNRFDTVHIAAYSTRCGTIAAKTMVDDIAIQIKEERLSKLEILQERISSEINSALIGSIQEVLFTDLKNNKWQGRNRNDKLVFVTCQQNLLGQTRQVEITSSGPWSLNGKII